MKGSLHEPIPALAWVDGQWFGLHIWLSELREHEALTPISDEAAEAFMLWHDCG